LFPRAAGVNRGLLKGLDGRKKGVRIGRREFFGRELLFDLKGKPPPESKKHPFRRTFLIEFPYCNRPAGHPYTIYMDG
jgi:hypothetical protein